MLNLKLLDQLAFRIKRSSSNIFSIMPECGSKSMFRRRCVARHSMQTVKIS